MSVMSLANWVLASPTTLSLRPPPQYHRVRSLPWAPPAPELPQAAEKPAAVAVSAEAWMNRLRESSMGSLLVVHARQAVEEGVFGAVVGGPPAGHGPSTVERTRLRRCRRTDSAATRAANRSRSASARPARVAKTSAPKTSPAPVVSTASTATPGIEALSPVLPSMARAPSAPHVTTASGTSSASVATAASAESVRV